MKRIVAVFFLIGVLMLASCKQTAPSVVCPEWQTACPQQ